MTWVMGWRYLQPSQLLAEQVLQAEPPALGSPRSLSPPEDLEANRDIRRRTRLPLQVGQRIPRPLLPILQRTSNLWSQCLHSNS